MAETQKPAEKAAPPAVAGAKPITMNVRLAPVNNSDQPLLANIATLNMSPGMGFVDFGFLEPGILNALQGMATQGAKMPEELNGKLVVRVALGYDAMANLHQQLSRALTAIQAQQQGTAAKKTS
jgi:hypothetical protein